MVFVTDLTAELTILLYPTGGRVQPRGKPGYRKGFARGGAEERRQRCRGESKTKGNQGGTRAREGIRTQRGRGAEAGTSHGIDVRGLRDGMRGGRGDGWLSGSTSAPLLLCVRIFEVCFIWLNLCFSASLREDFRGLGYLVQLSGSGGLVLEHLLEDGGDGMLLRLGDFSDRTGQP